MSEPVPPKFMPRALSAVNLWRYVALVRNWWRRSVIETLDHDALLEVAKGESKLSGRFIFLMMMSSAIAMLGMLQSSPAVVIGAMLLSPLMGPIIGFGFALATGDTAWIKKAGRAIGWGCLVGGAVAAILVFVSPLSGVTEEIATRTRPNLLDLGVAIFSGMAGAYAEMHRRAAALVGVAIATALVPPLAAVGYGVATFNRAIAGGAGLLLLTNLVAISLTAALMARLHGFHAPDWRHLGRWQALGVVFTFALLAVPLSISLRQLVWEVDAPRTANAQISQLFGPEARVSDLNVQRTAHGPIRVTVTIFTPEVLRDGEAKLTERLEGAYGRPVRLSLDQLRVNPGMGAEEAELNAARDRAAAEQAAREARDVAIRMALAAQVSPGDVLVDRESRRALLRVAHRDGMGLADWYEIEKQVQTLTPEWDIQIVPPPETPVLLGGEADAAARKANDELLGWAATRVGLPLKLDGDGARAEEIREALRAQNVIFINGDERAPLRLSWVLATEEE